MTDLQERLAAARGDVPCDLVVANVKVINVFNAEILPGTVGIHGGYIVGMGDYEGTETIDAGGAFMVPGFVEGHIHVESTMLTIPAFARVVLPHGTTSAVIDPHEIANVFGLDGIRFMLDCARSCPLDIVVMLPSCVPASPFESSGAILTAADLATLINEPRVGGIGELMNFPAVLNGDLEFLARAALARGKVADGHAPLLSGKPLNAYICAGVQTEHECTRAEEALEKLRNGMHIHVREGSTEHNLADLVKIITPENSRNMSLVTDDRHPDELKENGHLNYSVRLAIEHGIPPITAIQMASINTARCYHLEHTGALAPGYKADFFLTENLEKCAPVCVFKNGRKVAENGECLVDTGTVPSQPGVSMQVAPLSETSFAVKAAGKRVRVIHVAEDQIITEERIEPAPQENGMLISDTDRDLLKIAVIERHHGTGRIGVGLVHGLGLKQGAIASTVAHDAHNIIVAGVEDEDLLCAANALVNMGGGLTAVRNNTVLAQLPLPIAGLMSDEPVDTVITGYHSVCEAARELGAVVSNPYMTLSFLALTPIPAIKITDRGLFDATRFEPVDLFVP
jgi:adenine deaminase